MSWIGTLLCRIGIHRYPSFIDAYSYAPAPVRCERCGHIYR